ncbi:dipeptidase PepV [Halanaerobium sp. Z-7514]|uniref:Dipeptidase PepV n=1 Tax=Halanaerobium polyolivorans TaxID=2886943 RepID=A0AAW4WS70_9FIRM|nr:dipeptidase PepV [Halanaerobium polyolivorans]MCC3143856.1 dipeptidase PepV [Halanaerobium polyolivorans]RQD77774.1 MAG: dipeptidase PepV [Halanaerobium sp. MSAO_Bac5]
MKDKILNLAATMKDDIIKSTQELIKIASVKSKKEGNYPYGKNVYLALEKALEIAAELGFKTKNVDNYAGHVEIGQGEEVLGILCHLDVVPEGSSWTYPPYAAEINSGRIYGRGAIDDKGPAVAALYAMKIVDLLDLELKQKVRLILGTDEESGMESIDYYFQKEKMPELAFSPDAVFPAIHAEKGILDLKFSQKIEKRDDSELQLIALKGGNAANMVADYAEAIIKGINIKKLQSILKEIDYDKNKLEISEAKNGLKLAYNGISAHASLPEDGENAISHLINILAQLPFGESDIADFLKFYQAKIGLEYDGSSIGCADQDDIASKLTFNSGIITINQREIKLIVNIRYPVKSSSYKVINDIEKSIEDYKIKVELQRDAEPLYIEKNDPFIKKLMAAYQEITGDQSQPIAIGGGTYARKVKKGVAFGPLFPEQEELAHQKDEYIVIDKLLKSAAIYAKAIIDIAG